MSRWKDYRAGKYRRAFHAVRKETSSTASRPFQINRNASLEEQAKQVRQLLQQMGLGYSCLALYLSSRIDLLPAEFCREFFLTPNTSPPLSPSEIQRILDEEFSGQSSGVFAEFNPRPVCSTLLSQSYAARLANGAVATVIVLRPESYALSSGPEVPASFNRNIVQEYCGDDVNEAVFLDFFSSLRRKCNFAAQVETLQRMAQDSVFSGVFRSPKIYRELTTKRVLTFEQLQGLSIEEIVGSQRSNKDGLARTLCQAWLYQALRGNGFAVDPGPQTITLVEDAVTFTGCDFISLPPSVKENLWNYLIATAADDPDKAALYLLREMLPARRRNLDPEMFRSKFRQSAYFGMLEPVLGSNSNALAQLIFQHWKTALEHGYTPSPHLLCFYRGVFSIARIARQLAPLGDPLREGMEEVRNDVILAQMREVADWHYWFQNSDKYATALVTLPKNLDEALTRSLASGQPAPDDSGSRRNAGVLAADITTVLAMVATFFLFQSSHANSLEDKIVLLILLLAGWVALKRLAD